jgi:uncharacterized membrane protein (DUF106 family)
MGVSIGDIFGAGGVAGFAKSVIERFVPDPAAKAAAIQKLAENQIEVQKMSDDLEVKLNDIAGQNIRADAASGDTFTERARPMFMYIIESILVFNYIGIPIAQMFGSHITPIVLPPDLLTLFGISVTGYVMARSVDKALALPGDSSVNVAGIIKAGNKQ